MPARRARQRRARLREERNIVEVVEIKDDLEKFIEEKTEQVPEFKELVEQKVEAKKRGRPKNEK